MMDEIKLNFKNIERYSMYLSENEKSAATISKYTGVLRHLHEFVGNRPLSKSLLLEYRDRLRSEKSAKTINGSISAINSFLIFAGAAEMKLKLVRIQRSAFIEEKRELTETEYKRLLMAAKNCGNIRLYYLLMTVCSTGIRISELSFFTAEAVKKGSVRIYLKGKDRVILIPKKLRGRLLEYIKKKGIRSGCVFCTSSGKALDRSNICHDMKKICREAEVDQRKVFPHNLRHLFARMFYAIEKNISHLSDILGHSSIETTRIYVTVSAKAHERVLTKMKLVP